MQEIFDFVQGLLYIALGDVEIILMTLPFVPILFVPFLLAFLFLLISWVKRLLR